MPLHYGVDLTRAGFYAGTPGYQRVIIDGPLLDAAVMCALFAILLPAGALLFDYRERTR